MSTSAPRLLVSVRSAAEARDALAGGAHWIDLKEPLRGALGPVDARVARDVVSCVAGRTPVSAAAGELVDWPQSPARELLQVAGVSHLKLGLAGCGGVDWPPRWEAARAEIQAAGKQLVAVIYGDAQRAASPASSEILQLAAASPGWFVLWDTFDKSAGPLHERLSTEDLASQLVRARAAGHRTVVAGRLDAAGLAQLPLDLVDIVAVRGAVCRDSRTSPISAERVAELSRVLAKRHGMCGARRCSHAPNERAGSLRTLDC